MSAGLSYTERSPLRLLKELDRKQTRRGSEEPHPALIIYLYKKTYSAVRAFQSTSCMSPLLRNCSCMP